MPWKTSPEKHNDIIGKRFGRITVTGTDKVDNPRSGRKFSTKIVGKCDCGNTWTGTRQNLVNKTKSCGCLNTENRKIKSFKHGRSGTSEYYVWVNMISRCHNKNNKQYDNYGGRGIFVCQEWRDSVERFLIDMGKKPSPDHEIDRINNNEGYRKENCRWVTRRINMCNTRKNVFITHGGETRTISEWATRTGINKHKIAYWVRKGKPVNDLLSCKI